MVYERLMKMLQSRVGEGKEDMYTAYILHYIATIGGMMGVKVKMTGSSPTPCNVYTMCLAPSGAGKNYSETIVEETLLQPVLKAFKAMVSAKQDQLYIAKTTELTDKYPDMDESEIKSKAAEYANILAITELPFDSGTRAGIRAYRAKCIIAGMGTLSMSVDEIGAVITDLGDILGDFLTMHGNGSLRTKLLKGDSANRNEYVDIGTVPANLLMFGSKTKLLDGGKIEDTYMQWLSSGYARRLVFADIPEEEGEYKEKSALDVWEKRASIENEDLAVLDLSHLITVNNLNKVLEMDKEEEIKVIQYGELSKRLASQLSGEKEHQKAELMHRDYKMIKIAGALAFINNHDKVEASDIDTAIEICNASTESFKGMAVKEHNFIKLAKYLASNRNAVTLPDMIRDLPYMPSSTNKCKEIISLAVDWGYSNCFQIEVRREGLTDFYSGSKLKETDPDKLIVSFSKALAYDYKPAELSFEQLSKLVTNSNWNWCNSYFEGNHRGEDNVIGGSNLIVLDVDDGLTIEHAKILLSDFTYIIYTTKSHTEEHNRYRVILPMTHIVTEKGDNYKKLMLNVNRWLPFNDSVTTQRSRKWAGNNGELFINKGELMPTMHLLPQSSVIVDAEKRVVNAEGLDAIGRWLSLRSSTIKRNNTLIRYCFILKDSGIDLETAKAKIIDLNSTFEKPLALKEIKNTIFKTLEK